MALGILAAFALCAVYVAALILTDYWRLFPLWLGWLMFTCWQSMAWVFWADPMDTQYWLREWAPVEKVTLALAVLAVAESAWFRTRSMEPIDRFWLRFGLAVMPFSVVFYFARVDHGKPFAEFLQWREYVWIWLGLTCFTAWLFFFWRRARAAVVVRRHMVILMVVMMAHALAAPQIHFGQFAWFDWQSVFRIVMIICCGLWSQNIARLSRAANGAPRRPYRPEALPIAAQFAQSQPRSEVARSQAAQV